MSLRSILASEDIVSLSQMILGATITTNIDGLHTSGRIVETEAYRAPDDKGSHAYGNRRTARTETIFGEPGKAYVYLCYGIHHMLNIVTGPKEVAHAILIRAVEPLDGVDIMARRRGMSADNKNLTNGPGKLAKALGITTALDGYDLCDSTTMFLSMGKKLNKKEILCSPRVGIAYAEECAHWPWRMRIKNNSWTSPPHEVSYPT